MMRLWRIATDTASYQSDDMSGKGAEITGGRWNRIGTPVVYTSGSIALSALETIVHLNAASLPLNRVLVEISVPASIWNKRRIESSKSLAVGWSVLPEGRVSLDLGTQWAKLLETALLQVPSVVVPEEFNVLINPMHPDSKRIRAKKVRVWQYDSRLS
jgi:RES domain-containing protein